MATSAEDSLPGYRISVTERITVMKLLPPKWWFLEAGARGWCHHGTIDQCDMDMVLVEGDR